MSYHSPENYPLNNLAQFKVVKQATRGDGVNGEGCHNSRLLKPPDNSRAIQQSRSLFG